MGKNRERWMCIEMLRALAASGAEKHFLIARLTASALFGNGVC